MCEVQHHISDCQYRVEPCGVAAPFVELFHYLSSKGPHWPKRWDARQHEFSAIKRACQYCVSSSRAVVLGAYKGQFNVKNPLQLVGRVIYGGIEQKWFLDIEIARSVNGSGSQHSELVFLAETIPWTLREKRSHLFLGHIRRHYMLSFASIAVDTCRQQVFPLMSKPPITRMRGNAIDAALRSIVFNFASPDCSDYAFAICAFPMCKIAQRRFDILVLVAFEREAHEVR